ncbi:hypothetical protein [Robertmurraya sp.]|uniref:hypothetical protein n=1 Tax=Robertmurraya sp. TaxID=2837525 RepID=UPI0037037744
MTKIKYFVIIVMNGLMKTKSLKYVFHITVKNVIQEEMVLINQVQLTNGVFAITAGKAGFMEIVAVR